MRQAGKESKERLQHVQGTGNRGSGEIRKRFFSPLTPYDYFLDEGNRVVCTANCLGPTAKPIQPSSMTN